MTPLGTRSTCLRAARSLPALWRGAACRGMGGMLVPRPGSSQHPRPETRLLPGARQVPARRAFMHVRAAWAAPSRCPRTVRTGNSAFRVFTKPRDTRHESRLFFESQLPCPRFPTISHDFPAFPGPPHPPPPIKCPRAVRLSWSAARDCRPRPVAAFLRVVARHGAAMARHGRPPSPAPSTRPVGFLQPRDAQHVFPSPSGDSKESNPKPGQRFFTNHETRDTKHGFYSSLPAISHDFPAFPTISRGWGGLRNRCSSAVAGKSHKNAQNPGSHRKMREARRSPPLPPPSGLLGLRPTQNELMMRKEDVLYQVDQSAYDRFFFYSGDRDEPRRVHVARDDRVAKFWLACISHHVARRSA